MLNAWTGECVGCSTTLCISCSTKLGNPQCAQCNQSSSKILKSKLKTRFSQSENTLSCIQKQFLKLSILKQKCSDYEQNCVQYSDYEKSIQNPFNYNSEKYKNSQEVRWTKSNQCRIINSDFKSTVPLYSNKYMFYNSLIQKCQVCQTNTGCKKTVKIPLIISFSQDIQEDILVKDYLPNGQSIQNYDGDYIISLVHFLLQGTAQTIQFREALYKDDAYVKYSQEGVEEIIFELIFASDYKDQEKKILQDINLDFNISFQTQAMEIIPSLKKVKIEVKSMAQKDFASRGKTKLKIYLLQKMNFDSFTDLTFINIDLQPLVDNNDYAYYAESQPFQITMTNTLIPARVTFQDCVISSTQAIPTQKNLYKQLETGVYFQLIVDDLESLTLNNFELSSIYYPPEINFFDTGVYSEKFLSIISNSLFSNLQFSHITVFGLNNTLSSLNWKGVTIKGLDLINANFIKEIEGLKKSLIRIDITQLNMEDIHLTDSFFVYVMNAVRFFSSDWTLKGPFNAKAVNQQSSVFTTNLISLNKIIIKNGEKKEDKFAINNISLFSTPPYSLLIKNQIQINHRYFDVTIDKVSCELSTSQQGFGSQTCFFDLSTPYNPRNYRLNIKMDNVLIQDTQTESPNLQLDWYLMSLQKIEVLEITNMKILSNYKYEGIFIYNPNKATIQDFVCGDIDDSVFNNTLKDYKGDLKFFDESKLHGSCIFVEYCQKELYFNNISLQNYVGYPFSPFSVICNGDIKDQYYKQPQLKFDNFKVENVVLFIAKNSAVLSAIEIYNQFEYQITFNKLNVKTSKLLAIQIDSVSEPSSTVLLVDSVSSTLEITNSMIQDTFCIFTQNAMQLLVESLKISNTQFRDANQDLGEKEILTNGGFINARAKQMNFNGIKLYNGIGNKGSGMYLKTIAPGIISIFDSTFESIQSSLYNTLDGIGGAIFIDCIDSSSELTIEKTTFKQVLARTVGGALYIDSSSFRSTITIKNSWFIDVYAPQASLIYALQTNDKSSITFDNVIVEWRNYKFIDEYIFKSLAKIYTGEKVEEDEDEEDKIDPILSQALENHCQIFISKGSLFTTQMQFINLKYQTLFILVSLKQWIDQGSIIHSYGLTTYPLIFTQQLKYIQWSETKIQNVYHFTQISDSFIQQKIISEKTSVISHNKDKIINYKQVIIENNVVDCNRGFTFFNNWKNSIIIEKAIIKNNIGQFGVLYFLQGTLTGSSSSKRILEVVPSARILTVVPSATIQDSVFSGNSAKQGAAINSFSSKLTITGSIFENNKASGSGGAIYSWQNQDFLQPVTFSSLTFKNNFAKEGGAFTVLGINPTILKDKPLNYNQNVASFYGSKIVESPVAMRVNYNGKIYDYKQGSSQTPKFGFYGSGQNPGNLIIQLVGEDNKILRGQTDTCTVSLNYNQNEKYDSSIQIVGDPTQNFDENIGGYNFTSILFIAKPPNVLKIKFKSSAVVIPIKNSDGIIKGYDTSYQFPVEISMRPLYLEINNKIIGIQGEIYEATTGKCYACPQYKYSLQLDAESCLNCPKSGVKECPGYNILDIEEGYWRKNTSSDFIEECKNLPANCIGGYDEKLCYEGHIGALCEECDLYGEKWGQAYALGGSYKCGKCSDIKGNLLKVILISVWTLINTLLSVKATIFQIQQFICHKWLIEAKFLLDIKSNNPQNQVGVLLKILTSYFQVIAVLFTFKLTLPSFLESTSSTVGNPTQQMSVSMDCFFLDMTKKDMHVVYFRLIWQLISPCIFVFSAILIYFIGVITKKIRKNIGYIWCTLLFLFVTLQPSVVSSFISTASCRNIGNVLYIKANVSLECYTKEHMFRLLTLMLPCLLAWGIVIPILFFIKLFSYRKQVILNLQKKYKLEQNIR